ncbi:MAG TPA: hypothetical protein VJS40_02940, partial [Aestuariivirgaceae bacterium]|nr:hypothetical protein [Aestuariivirgaceae bacterium]
MATLAALLGVTYDKWSPEQGTATGIVATSPVIDSAAAPSSDSKDAATAETSAQTAAPAAQSEPTELAAIDPQSTTEPSSEASTRPQAAVDDSVPTFDTIRVETDGSAVMAGRGMPDADVTVMLDGQALGTTRTDSGGAWVFVPEEPFPAGDHDLTLRMQMANAEPVDSHQSVALKVPEHGGDEALVVLNDPNQASKVLQKPPVADVGQETSTAQATAPGTQVEVASASPSTGESATVPLQTADTPLSLNTVDYNDAGDIIFSGQAPAGTSVRLYVDNKSVGDAKVDATGAWTFAGRSQIQPGNHTLRIDQLATGAKVAQRIELPFVRAEPQQVAALVQSTAEPPAAEQPAAVEQPAAAEQSASAEASAPVTSQNEATAVAEEPPATAVEPPASSATADGTVAAPAPTAVEPAQPSADAPPSETAAMTSEDLAPAEIPDPTSTESAEPSQATDSAVAAAAPPAPAAAQDTGANGTGASEPSTATATETAASPETTTAADAQAAAPPPEDTVASSAPAEE